MWRKGTRQILKYIHENYTGPIIVPITIYIQDYLYEIYIFLYKTVLL